MQLHANSLTFICGALLVATCFADRDHGQVSLHIDVDGTQSEAQQDEASEKELPKVALFQTSVKRAKVQESLSGGEAAAAPESKTPAESLLQSDAAALSQASATAENSESLASWPWMDDSRSSAPALFAYAVTRASGKLALIATNTSVYTSLSSFVSEHWAILIFAFLLFIFGIALIWFNEIRQVKMDALLIRGLNECESIDANKVTDDTLGCLVHVVGQTYGASPVVDPQFQASVANCLKLQSTVEVFEWVQTVRIGEQVGRQTSDNKRSQIGYHFQKEWSTVHRSSLQFQRIAGKASPDNPKLPRGLNLGTFTSVCRDIKLGGFTLPDDMGEQFRNFEVVPQFLLPPMLNAFGVSFYANSDGYFYSRPSNKSMWSKSVLGPTTEPMVGDIRVRFLYVPQGTATVVAVHCKKHDSQKGVVDSFVPYRAIPRGCCSSEGQDRQRLIEEGTRSVEEIAVEDTDMTPCMETKRLTLACCCCPCTTINACTKEVVTEEIYYVAEEKSPVEKPFEWVVPRSCTRVWFFRMVGWLLCYMAALSVLGSDERNLETLSTFKAYGPWAAAVVAAIVSTASATIVIATACLCYSPAQSLKWLCVMAIVVAVPFVTGYLDRHAGQV